MGLFTRSKPKIKAKSASNTGRGFDGWLKCGGCAELVHASELDENLSCCPKCDFHHVIGAEKRLEMMTDPGTFKEIYANLVSCDPLKFVDSKKYPDRLKAAKKKTGRSSAVLTGTAEIEGKKVAIGILDFAFMGGSMGSVVGEKITLLIEEAMSLRLPVIIVSASGGARMQESALSLMQMAKTSAALARLSRAKLPYISILTHPTTGGVTASFASLGDVIIAEPKTLIAFAGPRVIEETMREKLPEGAQRAEFLLERGMVDMVVPRARLKKAVSNCLNYLIP